MRHEPRVARYRPTGAERADPPIIGGHDSLASDPGTRFNVVLTNPPFGRKSSIRVVNDAGEEERQDLEVYREDFWATTKNKQLNFVQHVKTLLDIHGRAAVVVPDNVLFEAARAKTVRRKLLHEDSANLPSPDVLVAEIIDELPRGAR